MDARTKPICIESSSKDRLSLFLYCCPSAVFSAIMDNISAKPCWLVVASQNPHRHTEAAKPAMSGSSGALSRGAMLYASSLLGVQTSIHPSIVHY